MSALARRRNRDTNTWPGFVDALASLLMVIIFVLMIFIVAQFYLTQLLSGKDETLARLNQQLAELTDLLSLEREANAELRVTVAQLSAELQTSLATRDRLSAQVDRLTAAQSTLESRLADLTRERAVLQGRIDTLEAGRTGIDARLLEVLKERDALLGKMAEVEHKERIATSERDAIAADLERAIQVVNANRDTIELQLKDLERLRRDLVALRKTRDDLEDQVASLAALRARLEVDLEKAGQKVASLQSDLASEQKTAEELRAEREALEATRKALRAELAAAADKIARLDQSLGAERDKTKALEATLADQTERTLLAQREIEARDIRLEELFSELNTAQESLVQARTALTAEEKVSSEAQQQVELLNAQIAALRQQLARIEKALEISEQENEDKRTRIVDLGRRLNAALATKVQELARFRSEFFGRLREVLSGRQDIRVVGDRFVFQSEVLFESGSAEIGTDGQGSLAQLAATLKEISARIPTDINWILQIEGHTDTVPIYNEQFANNWELSAARAISVVEFLIEQGIPASRLSATGYGEFQPIDTDRINRNRRIELKLTQR
ncbi:MAG: peptidoglycan -binding protein [Thalassobaculaceae bacterium]|nr:peptidoglycan -binding protein [Thalassobaculaceae bacterium]